MYVTATLIGLSVPDANYRQNAWTALVYDLQLKLLSAVFSLHMNYVAIVQYVLEKVVEILLMSALITMMIEFWDIS